MACLVRSIVAEVQHTLLGANRNNSSVQFQVTAPAWQEVCCHATLGQSMNPHAANSQRDESRDNPWTSGNCTSGGIQQQGRHIHHIARGAAACNTPQAPRVPSRTEYMTHDQETATEYVPAQVTVGTHQNSSLRASLFADDVDIADIDFNC